MDSEDVQEQILGDGLHMGDVKNGLWVPGLSRCIDGGAIIQMRHPRKSSSLKD